MLFFRQNCKPKTVLPVSIVSISGRRGASSFMLTMLAPLDRARMRHITAHAAASFYPHVRKQCPILPVNPAMQTAKKKHSSATEAALECIENDVKISAWRIKQERFLSVSQMAQSRQIQGIQAVEMFVSGAIKNGLLPTCCLRIAAQGCAEQQVGSLFLSCVCNDRR